MGFFKSLGSVAGGAIGSLFGPAGTAVGASLGGSLGGAVEGNSSSIISGGISYLGGQQTNSANTALSRDQMAFQERMSSTAHQREVADLKKAGLNPMLTGKYGGSSTPGGSMPTMQNAAAGGVSSALAGKRLSLDAENLKAQTGQINSSTELNQALRVKAQADATQSLTSAAQTQAATKLMMTDMPRRKNEAAAQSSWWKRNVSPYLPDFSGGNAALKTIKR